MTNAYQITECVGYYGDLCVVSDHDVAHDVAVGFAALVWPTQRLQWVDDNQLMDRPGGAVYIRIAALAVDNPAPLLAILSDIQQHGFKTR